ncbi:MAG: GldG family protein [Candidatus Krumholzibacteria bacterium]|nr:GldG family protein [Candidatus Krumholzibacteria bacterium]MDH4336364.1 GldG family protein [Candidatus Krumholzibacteria bacterium]MDH5269489.1 GldG family protein [Candidatus Krumholzibacteria bacterium]
MPTPSHTPDRTALWRLLAGTGVALLFLGVVLSAARVAPVGARAALVVAGAAIMVLALVANRSAVAAFSRRRATRRGADTVLATLFFVAILVVIQATSVRRSHQFDLTRNQRNTLAPQSVALLDSLDHDVTATGFYRQSSLNRSRADELLSLYARASSRFRYEFIDPDRNPDAAERAGATVDEVVIECNGVVRRIHTLTEQDVTNAILQVTRVREKVLYFVNGHGERDVDGSPREGYRAATRALTGQGYAVRTLSLLTMREVPADCDVLVIAGPREDYLADEVTAIDRYLRAGGSALFMLDPRFDFTRLAGALDRYRLRVLDAVILDDLVLDAGERTFDATVAKVRRYEKHPITEGFNYVTMFTRARPVYIPEDTLRAGLDVQYLAITDAEAWGETDMNSFTVGRATRDGVDIAGPMPLAAVATRTPVPAGSARTSRVVLVGDSDFASNSFYGVLGNADFFQNIVAFLSEDEDLIRIRPRAATGDTVYISAAQGRMVFAVSLVLVPLITLIVGASVVFRRRAL